MTSPSSAYQGLLGELDEGAYQGLLEELNEMAIFNEKPNEAGEGKVASDPTEGCCGLSSTHAVDAWVQGRSSVRGAHLAAALAKAQAAMTSAPKSKKNPYFDSSYADLAAVWDACRKPLTDNGLSVVQMLSSTHEKITVTTRLMHSSGEFLESVFSVPLEPPRIEDGKRKGASPVQVMGSAITYARRYALAAMVGVAPEDEDDDGEAASGRAPAKKLDKNEKAPWE